MPDELIETDQRDFFRNVESFTVYYQDNIIFEKYYHGISKDSLHQIQSQTKSIVSLLLGIAIDKGYIKCTRAGIGWNMLYRGRWL